jgi:hypothetical protein
MCAAHDASPGARVDQCSEALPDAAAAEPG